MPHFSELPEDERKSYLADALITLHGFYIPAEIVDGIEVKALEDLLNAIHRIPI